MKKSFTLGFVALNLLMVASAYAGRTAAEEKANAEIVFSKDVQNTYGVNLKERASDFVDCLKEKITKGMKQEEFMDFAYIGATVAGEGVPPGLDVDVGKKAFFKVKGFEKTCLTGPLKLKLPKRTQAELDKNILAASAPGGAIDFFSSTKGMEGKTIEVKPKVFDSYSNQAIVKWVIAAKSYGVDNRADLELLYTKVTAKPIGVAEKEAFDYALK